MAGGTRSTDFGWAARLVAAEARRHGLLAPGFRSPPGLAGAHRTIRRLPSGGAMVAVRLRDRPFAEVVADMVEGVLVANGLQGADAARWRAHLTVAAGVAPDRAA